MRPHIRRQRGLAALPTSSFTVRRLLPREFASSESPVARSRATIELDFEGRGIGKLLPLDVIRSIALKQAPRSYRNLKERLESSDWRGSGSAGATLRRRAR